METLQTEVLTETIQVSQKSDIGTKAKIFFDEIPNVISTYSNIKLLNYDGEILQM